MNSAAVPEEFSDIERGWKPGPIIQYDHVDVRPAADLAALLDQPSPVSAPGDPLPPLWHWLLFPALHRQAHLGLDGHPRDGSLTPPLADRRRMFGGGRVRQLAPLRCGDDVERREAVVSVRTTLGASGPLLLVTVRHDLFSGGHLRISEEQDLIYRRAKDVGPTSGSRTALKTHTDDHQRPWRFVVNPDPVLLFRFSSLTANAHRIHYDRPYATQVEHHRGLVVHGALLAVLMLELPRGHARGHVTEFQWRARRPMYEQDPIFVSGQPTHGGATLSAGTSDDPDRVVASVCLADD